MSSLKIEAISAGESSGRKTCSSLRSAFNADAGKFSLYCLRLKAEIGDPRLCSRCILSDKGKEVPKK